MYFQTKMEILALLKIFFFFNQKRGFKLLADRRSCQKSKQCIFVSKQGISCKVLKSITGRYSQSPPIIGLESVEKKSD